MVGIVLALAGLVFLGLSVLLPFKFRPESVLEAPPFGRPVWTGALFGVVLGVGFILAGWYFLRLDVDGLDEKQDQPASRFALFFLAHRRELKVIAQAGLVISLIRLVAVCFGHDWLERWAAWPLVLAWIGLLVIGRQISKPGTIGLNWQTVPERLQPALKAAVTALKAAFLTILLVLAWDEFSHYPVGAEFARAALIVLAFAWESLFFAYGEVRADREIN
jgi:hypothetical protein